MKKPIEEAMANSRDLLLLYSSAVVIAIAINFLCACIVDLCPVKWICLVIGVVLLASALVIISFIFPMHKEYVFLYEGGIAYEINDNTIHGINIAGYKFNDDFNRYLRGFVVENPIFSRYLKDNADTFLEECSSFDPDKHTRLTILRSVLECVVLNQLSLHLNGFFAEREIDSSRITCLKRSNLTAGVLRNKVLDTVSRDIEDRNAFADFGPKPKDGEVAFAISKNGVIYDRINLELPPGSCLNRDEDGFLVVSTKVFSMKIIPKVNGCCINIDSVLMPSNISPRYCPLMARVKLVVSIRRKLINRSSDAEMYEWLDSFTERLREYISIDSLQKRMNVGMLRIMCSPRCDGSVGGGYSIVKVKVKDKTVV